jgi:uncharacterized damage-inducible protein DinB
MKKYFLDLFEFNNWANDKIILSLNGIEYNFGEYSPLKILSHIITVQETWLERVKGTKSYNIFLWDEYSLQELEVLSFNNHKEWKKFITKLSDTSFTEYCTYKNSGSKKNTLMYQDIFQHVINHSSYHRGQINQILKQNNIQPVNIDFINYC